ncbi:MAG TPA: hypothetical protein VFO29_10195 [Candidatus Rubrimentiphilum sp.]|nr:hypothetical protein [Candidatus Rubrimentiphilum sp.]
MSLIGRAFGARSKPRGDAPQQLEKVLGDLQVSELENEDRYAFKAPAAAETVTAKPIEPTAPPPSAEDHRERLEKLLNDARQISQLLEKEAAEAELAQSLRLDEKRAAVAKLAEAERDAEAQARALTEQRENAEQHRAQIDAEVNAAQHAVSAAEDSVKHLEALLAEARDVVIQTKSNLTKTEAGARDAAAQLEAGAAKIHEADAAIAKCREARLAAESEVHEAEAIALGIRQTAATLKQLREGPKLVAPTGIESVD